MKRIWTICAAAAVALGSCVQAPEILDASGSAFVGRSVSAIITMSGDEADTRVSSDYGTETWNFSWDEEDKTDNVYALCKSGTSVPESYSLTATDLKNGDKTATFGGSISALATQYTAVYTSDSVGEPVVAGESVEFDISKGQNGDLNNTVMLSNRETISTGLDAITIDPYLKHLGGFMILNVDFENVPTTLSGVTVSSVTYHGVNTYCTANLFDSNVGESDFFGTLSKGLIEVTPDETIAVTTGYMTPLYLNILPTTLAAGDEITVSINFSNGQSVVVTKVAEGEVLFDRAKFSTTNITCDFDKVELQYAFAGSSEDALDVYYSSSVTSYNIRSERHLMALSALIASGGASSTSYTFTLVDDIELSNAKNETNWTPIGSSVYSFNGTFDGDGKSISGLYIVGSDLTYRGLFGKIGSSSVVKNFTLESPYMKITSSSFSNGLYNGAAIGYAAGDYSTSLSAKISSITVNNPELTVDVSAIGSVVGFGINPIVTDCSSVGGTITWTGAIDVGSSSYNGVGGIIGRPQIGTIINCSNSTTIKSLRTSQTTDTGVGGIAGYGAAVTFSGCSNTGEISGYSCTGGILGRGQAAMFVGCTNDGTITSTGGSYTGGIVGYGHGANSNSTQHQRIYGCCNRGKISSSSTFVGGLAGSDGRNWGKLAGSYNIGTVTGTDASTGSVIGSITYTDWCPLYTSYYLSGTYTKGVGNSTDFDEVILPVSSVSELNTTTVVNAMNAALDTVYDNTDNTDNDTFPDGNDTYVPYRCKWEVNASGTEPTINVYTNGHYVDPNAPDPIDPNWSYGGINPIIHTDETIANMINIIKTADSSTEAYKCYLSMLTHTRAQSDFAYTALEDMDEEVVMNNFDGESSSAYMNAMLYAITGDEAHGKTAANILYNYMKGCTIYKETYTTDTPLNVGRGYNIVCAFALLKNYEDDDFGKFYDVYYDEFKVWVWDIFEPILDYFYNLTPYTNGNWGMAVTHTYLAIAAFMDDDAKYEDAIDKFLHRYDNGAMDYYICGKKFGLAAYNLDEDTGQCQETGRDQGHVQYGLSRAASACEIAWHRGDNLYAYNDNILLKAFEYTAKILLNYNTGTSYDVPFYKWTDVSGKYCNWSSVNAGAGDSNNYYRPCWIIAYNHYVNRLGLEMPYTEALIRYADWGKATSGNNYYFYDGTWFEILQWNHDYITTSHDEYKAQAEAMTQYTFQ